MTVDSEAEITIAYPTATPPIRFGIQRLEAAVGGTTRTRDVGDIAAGDDVDVLVASGESGATAIDALETDFAIPSLEAEGFRIVEGQIDGEATIGVLAPDDTGAMYGALELSEQVDLGAELGGVEERESTPEVDFRAIKFNLPWSVYHGGAQAEIHTDTCRDLEFWEAFLDMMAENRFNALTLWNLHPFPFMVRTDAFPEACPFPEDELEAWQEFWHGLFGMAADRGIETYILNWNILVSPEFADAHDVDEWNDTSELVRRYTREHVRAVVNEYPNLRGLGVSLCDWMNGMSPAEKQDWLEETILEGIRQADRSVRFLDRSVLTESIDEMRRGIDTAAGIDNVSDIYVPTKFNWSHGHSTTSLELTHDYSDGTVDDSLWNPAPENYEIAWMIRNEDFFILRWGDPDFIREHIAENYAPNDYVGGYFVGSEVNIPAKDGSHERHEHQTWEYAFEKQWLFYMLWGRLLYDPNTPDEVFAAEFDRRYGNGLGERLLKGYRNASQMPLELASFHAGTWDYTLYSEGFLAPVESLGYDEEESAFISVDELIDHETLDSSYLSIPEYLDADGDEHEEYVTPLDVAERMDRTGDRAIEIAATLRGEFGSYTGALIPAGESRGQRGEADHNEYPGALECELDDIEAWGHLSRYFAAKLRGGVALERYRQDNSPDDQERAIEHLEAALDHWNDVVDVTESHYREVPYATDWFDGNTFSWAGYRDQVERDIRIAEEATGGRD